MSAPRRSSPRDRGSDGRRRNDSSARPAPSPARAPREERPARKFSPAAADMALARQPWDVLRPLLDGVSDNPTKTLERLRLYARLLFEWNRGVSNLVSHNDEPRLVERHLRESLAPARLLRESGCQHFVDFGSGAGLPALPLAIAGVGKAWTCVESRRNKTLFIRKAKQELDLKNFVVHTGRLEMLIDEHHDSLECDGFTSRATMTIAPTLMLAKDIVRSGGRAFLWKGSRYVEEMNETPEAWGEFWNFEAAHEITDGANVCAVFVRK